MTDFDPILLTLPSLAPSLAVEILPYGLTFHRVFVQADGRTHDIVIGPEDPRGHITQKYTNTIIGRYANRIPIGSHTIERNGVEAEVVAELNEGSRVSLHGGPVGFDSLCWTRLTPDTPPALFTEAELAHLPPLSVATSYGIFRLVSPDGDQGYPGTMSTEVLIALIPPVEQERKYVEPGQVAPSAEWDLGSILYVYRAKVDKGVTPVNLTQHWGFNLEASLKDGEDTLSVKNQNITIESDRIVARDADSLNIGNFIPVTSATEHLHEGQKIGDKYPKLGYGEYNTLSLSFSPFVPYRRYILIESFTDDYYAFAPRTVKIPKRFPISEFTPKLDLLKDVLIPSGTEDATRGDRPEPVVELSSDKSGLKLVFETNRMWNLIVYLPTLRSWGILLLSIFSLANSISEDGVMFYSNAWADPSKGARKKIHGGSGIKDHGDGYVPGTAAFLEFHDILAAFLDPANKDGNDTLLTSDEVYHNYVRCDVRFKQPAN
ncbi:galactose mutarotase-like domain-containing protein [Lentinula guzmanii]|uniref:Galactose mutarotase-like domain-containing protein n=1 Tax=Lentinula guzmanii TaxID=2804957 RepID=A0AA38N0U2_9AGAR|nr:galactose mutarotase-like domain-containing protein [Lentinula guzmanii]